MLSKQTDKVLIGASSALPIEYEQREAKKTTVKIIDVSVCPECGRPHNKVMLQVFAVVEGGRAI